MKSLFVVVVVAVFCGFSMAQEKPAEETGTETVADTQEPHAFGEGVWLDFEKGQRGHALGDPSLVVTKLDAAMFLSRYPSEFRFETKLLAFEFRFGGNAAVIYSFSTDRVDAAHSDIVLLCGTEPINILKIGSAKSAVPETYIFGLPGIFESPKDSRWISIAGGGSTFILFFNPAGASRVCVPEEARLSVRLDVTVGSKVATHRLLFSEHSSLAPPTKP